MSCRSTKVGQAESDNMSKLIQITIFREFIYHVIGSKPSKILITGNTVLRIPVLKGELNRKWSPILANSLGAGVI